MNPIDEILGLFPLRSLSYRFGDSEVGQEHELLDEFIGIFRFLEIDTYRFPCLIDLKAHLGAVELQSACIITAEAELFCSSA